MKLRFLATVLVTVSALIVVEGCSEPNPVANSTGTSNNSITGDVTRGSDSINEKRPANSTQPAALGRPGDANLESEKSKLGNADSADSDRPDSAKRNRANDLASKAGSTDTGNPNVGMASKKPTPKKEFKLEFVDATGEFGLNPGDTIPNIEGKDLDGIKFELSDYSGKVIMIDFWGDW